VMAMRHDVPLGLDVTAGRGVLPLPVAVVDAVFQAQNLVWSAGKAAQILAGADLPPRPVPEPWVVPAPTRASVRRLAVRVPASDQLALF